MKLIEIKLSGESCGNKVRDKIIIEIPVGVAETIEEHFKREAINCNDYFRQGIYRAICDFFHECYLEWEEKINDV